MTHTVSAALKNKGYAKAQVAVSGTNESAYVLVNCWRTLDKAFVDMRCMKDASSIDDYSDDIIEIVRHFYKKCTNQS